MNLYQLNKDTLEMEQKMEEWAIEHDGDITEFPLLEEFEALEMDREEKSLSVGVWYKNLTAQATALKAEKAALDKRIKTRTNKAESIKSMLQGFLRAGEKFENTQCALGWRKSTKVIPEVDPEELPEELRRVEFKPMLTEIKSCLKSDPEKYGEFARLETNQNIQIK